MSDASRGVSFPLQKIFPNIAVLAALAMIGAMVLLASGSLGVVHVSGEPVDRALVESALGHAILGWIVSCVQWAAAAAIARWLSREVNPSLPGLMLLGFPLSLVLVAACSWLTLAFPFGWVIATALLIACFSIFRWRPMDAQQLKAFLRVALYIMPMAAALGCWFGLLLHGPSSTLNGHPFGDVAWYASNMYTLQSQPYPIVNFANEGEYLPFFNELHSLFGAALMRLLPIDPFQFVLASGGSMFVVNLGVAIFAYLSTRPHVESGLAYFILFIAALVSTWYPLWTVSSTPMIVTLPVTICVWYRANAMRGAAAAAGNLAVATAASALGKITSLLTLAPLSVASLIDRPASIAREFRNLHWGIRAAAILIFSLTLSYLVFMLINYGPSYLAEGGVGPDSLERYHWAFQSGLHARRVVIPYLMRDCGNVLLVVVAFRLLRWNYALAVSAGLAAALVLPYAFRANLDCALIVLALAGVDNPVALARIRSLAVVAFALCLPVIVHHDYGGGDSTSGVWLICIGAMMMVVFSQVQPSPGVSRPIWSRALPGSLVFSAVLVLALLATARQEIAFAMPEDTMTIPSTNRDVWTAVRERTPTHSLIFTDQTGMGSGALAQWNSYATTGQRQIYIAGWYQTFELRHAPERLAERLKSNEAVLDGRIQPDKLAYNRGPYSDYFAVVSSARKMPPIWHNVYANAAYILYQYHSAIGP